ncbi:MAG: efflux RND transporter periplasmic adaptor subunit [Pedosphaera sp.]|nr:efflux RND transporter periplasmic adaptor subunit [Pedosphaera sp.]
MANSKKRRKLIIFLVLGVVLVALTLVAVFRKHVVVISVTTDKVARRNLTELVVANGKIQPVVQVVISPEVAGEIVALPVKEGDHVKKGDLLLQIKPDNYQASRNSADANHKSALANMTLVQTELERADAEFKRNEKLFRTKLVSDSIMLDFKTAFEVAKLRYTNSVHAADQARFALDKATDDLSKTKIVAPMDGTVTRLKSQLGERVLGTSFNMGTEIMTVADLNAMEARVDIGEIDVVYIAPGQKARLEVDSFKDRKFTGVVSEIANSSKGSSLASMQGSQSQEATKFEVKIRILEKESFRPGMSVSTEIETRYRTNVLSVPYAAITTRMPKGATNSAAGGDTNSPAADKDPNDVRGEKKNKDAPKAAEIVFVVEGDHAKQTPVKKGISDDNYWEILEGLTEGQEIVSGGYKAVNRELEDGKKIRKVGAEKSEEKEKK